MPTQQNDLAAALRVASRGERPKPSLGDVLGKVAASHVIGYLRHVPAAQAARDLFDSDRVVSAVAAPGLLVQRGVVSPATTTATGWANELVGVQNITDGVIGFAPQSVYAALAARSLRLNFAGIGSIRVPGRSPTPTVSGAFVGEGVPIPVRRAGLTGVTVAPRKLGVISEFSHELQKYAAPSIENILRAAMAEDTSITVDTLLLDTNAATAVRPAGLLNGVVATPATAGGGLAAMTADIAALVAAITAGSVYGSPVDPLIIVGPSRSMTMGLLSPAGTEGLAIVESPVVPSTRIVMVDANDFVSGAGDDLVFDVSKEALLHEEDTTPLPIGTTGSPAVVAAPVR